MARVRWSAAASILAAAQQVPEALLAAFGADEELAAPGGAESAVSVARGTPRSLPTWPIELWCNAPAKAVATASCSWRKNWRNRRSRRHRAAPATLSTSMIES